MSIDSNSNEPWYFFLKSPLRVFLQCLFFIFLVGFAAFLLNFLLHNPVKEFVNNFRWYVSNDSTSIMTLSEKKELARLMSKNYILSTNDLLSQVGSFFSYTITILVFFCTFSAFFAVLVIKMNAEDKFDATITAKVRYFFSNDKGFDKNIQDKVSEIYSEESEQQSNNNNKKDSGSDVIMLKQEVRQLKIEIYKLKSKIKLDPEDDEQVNTDEYLKNMSETLHANDQTVTDQGDTNNGNP